MSQLRIFSYLPNPRIWKATIAARLSGVEVEVRGSSPKELQSWLWDFDARPLSLTEQARLKEINRAEMARDRAQSRQHQLASTLWLRLP